MAKKSKKKAKASPDLKGLQREIAQAARGAFEQVRKAHANERFYAFLLYTEPLLGYLMPSCNSEEGLADDEVRWSPCDWDYHCEGEEHFEAVQDQLDAIREAVDEDDEEAFFALRADLWGAFLGALKDLDAEGFFGKGKARDEVLINIMWGDQDIVAHLKSAEELNPRPAFLAYARHELDGLRSHVEEFGRPEAKKLLKRLEAELAR